MDLSDSRTRRRVNKAFRERGIPAKACGTCFMVKGHGAFSRRSSAPDGCQAECRPCAAERTRSWYAANRDRANDRARRYNAEHADEIKAYNARKYRQDPERFKAKSAQWRRDNPDREAERNRTWRHRNPVKARARDQRRRATIAEASVEPFTARDLRHDWEDHDLYECFFCGGSLVDGYEVEHFYALSKGGPHALLNLLPSCAPCNRGAGGKGTKEPWSYLREALAEQGVDLDACIAILTARSQQTESVHC